MSAIASFQVFAETMLPELLHAAAVPSAHLPNLHGTRRSALLAVVEALATARLWLAAVRPGMLGLLSLG